VSDFRVALQNNPQKHGKATHPPQIERHCVRAAKRPPTMSSQTTLSRDLSVEDFRRLGVRPNEVRLSVIRGAASRNACPLANELLATRIDEPVGEDRWLQLSRVATSTYRLMDPRLRTNVHQRAYIGRILPLALSAATTTRFHSSHTRVTKYSDQQVSADTEDSDFGVSPPPISGFFHTSAFAASEHLANPTSQLSDAEIWQLSLDDADLASGNRLYRRRSRADRSLLVWASLSICGSLIGAILGWNSLATKPEIIAAFDQNQPMVKATPIPEILAERVQQSVAPSNAVPRPVASPPPQQEPDHSIASLPVVDDFFPINPSSTETMDDVGFDPDAIDPSAMDVVTKPDDEAEAASPDPPASIIQTETIEPSPTVDQGLFPAPRPEYIAIARRKILRSFAAQNVSISSVNFQSVRQSVLDVQAKLSAGSVDHYAATLILGSFEWLESSPRQPALQTITAPLAAYEIEDASVWAQTYIDASQHVTPPNDLEDFFTAGFGLIETLISQESFKLASEVLVLIQQRSDQFDDHDFDGLIASYQKSISYAQRISTTAQLLLARHGEVDSIPANVSGGSSLGRYYCLVLGDWSQGLRFLAQTSDPRLASLAKSELAMHVEDPFLADPAAWAELADQWQVASERLSGRSANQILLHAIDLLNRSSQRSTGVAKLNAKRQAETMKDRLPVHLKIERQTASAKTALTVSATKAIDDATPPPVDNDSEHDWLTGRISANGKDLGVQIRYQLDVPINQDMLQSIEDQLRRPLEDVTFELEGDFKCDDDRLIILTLSAPTDSVSETVFLDDEPIQLDPRDHSTRLLVSAGDHSIRWTIDLTGTQSILSCSLRDARTSERLTLTTSDKPNDAASSGDLTVSVMRRGNP
jgi:hypothetical protein